VSSRVVPRRVRTWLLAAIAGALPGCQSAPKIEFPPYLCAPIAAPSGDLLLCYPGDPHVR
jgi:hypothetical protein